MSRGRFQILVLLGLIASVGCRSDNPPKSGGCDEEVTGATAKANHQRDRDQLIARLEPLGFESRIENDEVLATHLDLEFSVIARFDSGGAKEYVCQFRPSGSEEDLMTANEVIALVADRMNVGPSVVWLVVNGSVRNQSRLEAVRDHDVMVRSHFLDPTVVLSLTRVDDYQIQN